MSRSFRNDSIAGMRWACWTVVTRPVIPAFQERDGFFQHGNIEVHLVRDKDDPLLFIDRCMSDVDEHIGIIKGIEREIAGTIAGIPADDDFEPCVMEPP